jgi:drug/metabolite transporter (DMT)-like permease
MAWSLGFPAGSVLMQSWDLLTLLVIRLLPSTIILLIYWRLTAGPLPLDRIIWKKGLIIGAIGFGFGSLLLLYGQHISNPVTPAIAAAMMPIMGAILEIVLDRRRLTIRLAMGITCALIGGLMAAGVRWHGYDIGVGFIWCLAAVMIYAWATRATTVNLKQLSSIGQTTVTLAGAGLFISIIWLIMAFIDPMQISIGAITANSLLMLFAFFYFISGDIPTIMDSRCRQARCCHSVISSECRASLCYGYHGIWISWAMGQHAVNRGGHCGVRRDHCPDRTCTA